MTGTLFERVFCYDCGETIETELEENYTETEAHWFEDGVCGVCGYENTCEHPYVNCDVRPLNWELTERDERTHTWGGAMVKVYTCSSCDEIIDEEEIEGADSVRELHEFENGECIVCGYVNECTHPQMAGMKRIGGVIEVISSDASGHTVVYEAFELKMCPFCHYMIDTPIASETRTEKHTFWFNECQYCGYIDTELSCTHENLSEEIYIAHEVSDQATADYHLSAAESTTKPIASTADVC